MFKNPREGTKKQWLEGAGFYPVPRIAAMGYLFDVNFGFIRKEMIDFKVVP